MRDPNPASESLGTSPNVTIGRLRNRADFLRAAKGRRWHGKAFSLQAHLPVSDDTKACAASGDQARGGSENQARASDGRTPRTLSAGEARAGFTVTKKVGNSVVRNRVRRRLREALRLCRDLPVRADHDYVIIARIEAIRLPFTLLQDDLARAIRSVHAQTSPRDAAKRPKRTTPSP